MEGRHEGDRSVPPRMARPTLTKCETNKSTDEDYESDDSDMDRLTTRLIDPREDTDTLQELHSLGKTVLRFTSSETKTECSVFLAETVEEGPLAAVFLSDEDQHYGQ